jgi:prephenate dehydrogenase
MKIALLGYGKMGQVIERIAMERGHEIVLKKDEHNTYEASQMQMSQLILAFQRQL